VIANCGRALGDGNCREQQLTFGLRERLRRRGSGQRGHHAAARPETGRGVAPPSWNHDPGFPNWFRHATAMRIYERTGDIAIGQTALNHKSIASSLVYTRVDAGRVRAAAG
jgi:site-specific recombinase XerC